MDHAFFVTASYVISALAIFGLAAYILLSSRAAKARLDAFERQSGDRS